MGYYLGVFFLVLAAALQSSLIPQLRIFSGQPDLVFVLVICWALHAKLEESLFWAFLGGLLQDILSITPLGTATLGMVMIIFTIQAVRQQLYRANLLLLGLCILFGTLLQQFIISIALIITGNGYNIVNVLRFVTLPEIFYNLILMLPVYVVVRLIQRRIYRPELAV
jgi:rod shape-determining protein MreD